MKVFKSAEDLHIELYKSTLNGKSIGFVPTMGALHAGHLSLIERAKAENVTVVCSIFVNPKQFNQQSDLNNYPRPIEKDIELLMTAGVDYLFHPEVSDIYNEFYDDVQLPLNGLDDTLEGEHRPGHFQGMAKVVKRLFEIVVPTNAYFGQKDFQQSVIVRHLISLYFPTITLVVCPIVREPNGLAMSSRNERLSADQRSKAAFIYKSLLQLKERTNFKDLRTCLDSTKHYLNSIDDAFVEYIEAIQTQTLQPVLNLDESESVVVVIVVRYGGVRLLDNIILKGSL